MKVEDTCIGCGACQSICPEIVRDEIAILPDGLDNDDLIAVCPMNAIVKD